MKSIVKNLRFWQLIFGTILLLVLMQPAGAFGASGDVVNCSSPLNLSKSEGYWSNDPFVIADPAGVAHLFWAERVTGAPGPGQPDTIMYSVWDGETWSEPIDIQLSPSDYINRQIIGVRGVLDNQGIIHLMWMGPDNTFFYSSARADEAGSAAAWQPPLLLSETQTGTQYSFDLAFEAPQTLHVVYGRDWEGESRSVSYIRSNDRGLTWSEPVDIFIFPDRERGASNIRLIVDEPDKLYATWTEWDLSGNGQVIYFARSLDGGDTWDYPVFLAERTGMEYERDWTNPMVLDENHLIVMWEGGFRAYPQAQYSDDGGVTWSEPIDTFYWLIADNGFASMLWDGSKRLHAFLVRRIREGYDMCHFPGCDNALARGSTNTIWHSVWEGGRRWREPKPVSDFGNGEFGDIGGAFTQLAIVGGNKVIAAYFSYTYQEIMVMECDIEGALEIPPEPWPTVTPGPTVTPSSTSLPLVAVANVPQEPVRPVLSVDQIPYPANAQSNPGSAIFLGILPVLLIIIVIGIVKQVKQRKS